jgi:periplasmic protein TonB
VSAAVHVAIIGAVTATTVHGGVAKIAKPDRVVVHFDRPTPARPRPTRQTPTTSSEASGPVTITPITIHRIDPPTTTPIGLPPIDSSFGRGSDSVAIGHGTSISGAAHNLFDAGDRNAASEWSGRELQTRIVASAKPRYPESLRQAAIDGVVVVRFVVDTSGRVDMSSVAVVSSTHDLFTRAVREALPNFRFKPAELGGTRVRALAEMPFEFQITR